MKNLELKTPTTWNQLNRKQLLFLCNLFLLDMSNFKFKLSVFLEFANVKALPKRVIADRIYYFFKQKKTRFSLTVDELHFFLRQFDVFTVESQLTKNLLPKFNLLWRCFYGPSNKCFNITFLEFLNVEAQLFAFHKTKKGTYLREVCAILYRPQVKPYQPNSPTYNGDRREVFNDFTYQRRAKWFRLLNRNKQYAVYIFYIGCRNALMEAHPNLFSSGSVSSEPVNPAENLKKTILALNLGDVTKNRLIQQTLVWDAFGQLEELVKQNKPRKK